MDVKKIISRLAELKGEESNGSFARNCGISEGTVRLALQGKVSQKTIQSVANYKKEDPLWISGDTDDRKSNLTSTENHSDYQEVKQKKDLGRDIERLERLHFKQLCPAYFDEIFDFIAENYGENKEAAEAFLKELQKTHSNYRTWMEEKTTRTDNQTGGKEPNEMTG